VEGDLVIVVADDGPGADPVDANDSRGYGLRVLRQRLAAIYGGSGGLEVETATGEGFRVTVRLPGERV
jgi:signal transduction histidine kinase